MNEHYLPRGINFARMAIAKSLAESPVEQHALAASRWGARSTVAEIFAKTAIGGNDGASAPELADSWNMILEMLELVRPNTVLGKMQDLRHVPVNTPYCAVSTGATAYWTKAGRATPVSKMAFARETTESLKVAALTVFDKALLNSSDPKAEALIRNDLARALIELSDRTFLDRDNGGIPARMPASVTDGATSIAATSDFADDVASAIDAFRGDLQTASWVLHPKLAAKLGLRAGGRGAAADLGARGGSLAGLPAIVSTACSQDSDGHVIALIDAASVCVVDEGLEIFRSTQATVEMDDAPSGDTVTPSAATTAMVSLFQTDSVGLIVSRAINWKLARPNAVVCITGCDYTVA